MSTITLGNLCFNTCNLSNLTWCLSGRRRNVKNLITPFFDTGIDDCKYFTHLMKKTLTSFNNFLYSRVPMMSNAPANMLLKYFKTSGSSKSVLNTSHDSEITSSRINLEKITIQMQSRMIQYMNQWFFRLHTGIKSIKHWNYRLDEHGIQLANRLFECIYQPSFSTRFLIWVVFIRVIIQIGIRQDMTPKSPIASMFSLNIFQELTTL